MNDNILTNIEKLIYRSDGCLSNQYSYSTIVSCHFGEVSPIEVGLKKDKSLICMVF